jgi:hypothetical protein
MMYHWNQTMADIYFHSSMRGMVATPPRNYKPSLLKKINESEELRQISFLMTDPEATVEQIGKAVIRLNMLSYMEAEQMIL